MATSASFPLFSPTISLQLHPNNKFSKALIMSKPPLFSSISIERLPTKVAASSSNFHFVRTQSVEDLPPALQKIIRLFQSVPDYKLRYEQVLFYGRNLSPLETKFKTKENRVHDCASQVWIRCFLDSDKKVHFEADSDSEYSMGLAALLVQGFSGQRVSDILTVEPSFIYMLRLHERRAPSRIDGFLNMFKHMKLKALQQHMKLQALQLYKEAEESDDSVESEPLDESLKPQNGGGEILKAEPGNSCS